MITPDRPSPVPAGAAVANFGPQPMAGSGAPEPFLDPRALIETSRPRPNRLGGLPLLGMVLLTVLVFSSSADSPLGKAIQTIAPLLFLGFWIGLVVMGRRGAARMALEAQAVSALDELIQLRRWPEAAELAGRLFARPMSSPERRMHALAGLATILTRYHRFEDARIVHDYLLQRVDGRVDESRAGPMERLLEPVPDPSTAHAIRVARAMGLLREDRLVDADRAMGELRREVNQARDEVRRSSGNEAAIKLKSAGLVLLDLYRDVKTRHYEEAVAGFEASREVLREQMGSRVADAWLLYAMALHGLNRRDDAEAAYANATALIPPVELHRRYPETAELADAYRSWPYPNG